MKCTFLGVGSAFDALQTNVSILLESANGGMLLDCGFNAAHACMRTVESPEQINVIWISHFHGDHFFGLPFLLGSFFAAGRRTDLHICGPVGIEDKVGQVLDLAYPTLRGKLEFKVVFHEFAPGDIKNVAGFSMQPCSIDHSCSALALRVDCNGKAVFYSGDGSLTDDCRTLAANVDLGILESYGLDEAVKGHSSVLECIDFATSAGMLKTALVHLEPFMRTYQMAQVEEALAQVDKYEILLPEEGESVAL